MISKNMKLYVCVLCFLLAHGQDISKPRNKTAVFECNKDRPGYKRIYWEFGTVGERNFVAYLINGDYEESEQWIGRTDIDDTSGDLTVHGLKLEDDGRYSCFYSDVAGYPPSGQGSSYLLEVTGRHFSFKPYHGRIRMAAGDYKQELIRK